MLTQPTTGGTQNGSSVGIYTQCIIVYKFLHVCNCTRITDILQLSFHFAYRPLLVGHHGESKFHCVRKDSCATHSLFARSAHKQCLMMDTRTRASSYDDKEERDRRGQRDRVRAPNQQRWYANYEICVHTLLIHVFCTFGTDLCAQSVISNKISASEPSRKFV